MGNESSAKPPAFGAATTTEEVLAGVDLRGRHVVITGAASGLGEESARALAAHGATVTLLARDPAKNEAAAERIRREVPQARLDLGTVDLASWASIRSFAAGFVTDDLTVDVLLNNAGVMACPRSRTVDGIETQFGTNHLGHFLLTALLYPALARSPRPRVVNLSSAGHTTANVDLDDINCDAGYDPWIAYGRSKTANALFTRGLVRRFGPTGLLAYSIHPGVIGTNLSRHLTAELIEQLMARREARSGGPGASAFEFKSVEAGAATQVWACVADLAEHNGAYLADCQVGVEGGDPNHRGFMSYLLDDAAADRLWTLSEDLVGTRFPAGETSP